MSMMYLHSKNELIDPSKILDNLQHNGIGPLYEALSATGHEELNGLFEIEFEYPVTGDYEILYGDIVMATPRPNGKYYPFVIDSISKPMSGIIKVHASHWSRLLSGVIIGPFVSPHPEDLMTRIPSLALTNQKSTFDSRANDGVSVAYPLNFLDFYSDISHYSGIDASTEDTKSIEIKSPTSIWSVLGDEIEGGSLLSLYTDEVGEYKYDPIEYGQNGQKNTIRFLDHRGTKKPITIEYGRNMTDFELEEDFSDVYTDIIPFYNDKEKGYVVGDPIHTEKTYPITKFMAVDVTSEFSNLKKKPTVTQVTVAGREYFRKNKIDEHEAKLTVRTDMSDDFKDLDLGDKIDIYYGLYGYTAELKCTEYTTDMLNDRYIELNFDTVKNKNRKGASSIIAQSSISTGGDISQSKKALAKTYETGSEGGSGSGISLSNATPMMDGDGAPGSSFDASRADHQHPSDTAKLSVRSTMTNTEIDDVMNN